ncbi:MAG: hypothetical protein IPK04_01640 [Bdellovibrionales bacterium]|nr:hypothetical protein [Bdellovibrionales bacterium]
MHSIFFTRGNAQLHNSHRAPGQRNVGTFRAWTILVGASLLVLTSAGCRKSSNSDQPLPPIAPTGQPPRPLPTSVPPGGFQPGQQSPPRPVFRAASIRSLLGPPQPGLPPVVRPPVGPGYPQRPAWLPADQRNRLICNQTVEKSKGWGIFAISKTGTTSKSIVWDLKKPVDPFSLGVFGSGASVKLTRGTSVAVPQIEVTYIQKGSEGKAIRKFTSKAPVEQGLTMNLFDDASEQEVVVDCYLEDRVVPIVLSGDSVFCKGEARSADGKSVFPIAKIYPWTGEGVLEERIYLGPEDLDFADILVTPQFGGRSAALEVNLEAASIKLSTSTVSSMTEVPTKVLLTESPVGFSLDLSCQIVSTNTGGKQLPK